MLSVVLVICTQEAFLSPMALTILMQKPSMKVVPFLSTSNKLHKHSFCHSIYQFSAHFVKGTHIPFPSPPANSAEIPLYLKSAEVKIKY